MTWELFYLVCFGLGLVLAMLSLLGAFGMAGDLSGVHAHLGMGHVHWGGGANHPGHLPGHGGSDSGVSWFNGFTLTAFLCWFGGAGYLLTHNRGFAAPVILLLSVVSGLGAAGAIFLFLTRVLLPHERALGREETETVGVVARVSAAIRPEGVGEIQYTQLGARRSAPARSETGEALEHGAEVYVVRYENGIASVRRWDDLGLHEGQR